VRQVEFEAKYRLLWQTFTEQLAIARLPGFKRRLQADKLLNFAQDYRAMCYCLSLARERHYSPYLIQQLEAWVFEGHQLLYQKRLGVIRRIYQFILYGFPRAVREQSRYFVWALAIFYLPGLVVFLLTLLMPEMVYAVVDPHMVHQIEAMYDPALEHFGRERQSDTDFFMFGFYIRNNIGIAFQCFAGGIVVALGTLFYLLYNGLLFGALAAHMLNLGYHETFYGFVSGHSPYELTGIVLSGAAGLQLGWAVIAPGRWSRRQALVNAGRHAMPLVFGAIVLLLIAAFVEAFWSSMSSVAPLVKYWVGAMGWLLVIGYFTLLGRR